jgi:hypothetical protein
VGNPCSLVLYTVAEQTWRLVSILGLILAGRHIEDIRNKDKIRGVEQIVEEVHMKLLVVQAGDTLDLAWQ